MEKQEQNGPVNGNHLKSIVDPYDELIKNHLLNEEKVKVSSIFSQWTFKETKVLQNQTIKIISISFELVHSCVCNGNKSMEIFMLNLFVWNSWVLFVAFYTFFFLGNKKTASARP